MSIHVDFQHYHTYEEMAELLRAFAAAHPGLTRLYSIGKSYEGREIWLLEISNAATGAPDDKPGYYMDANLHAGEVTGAACALYTIHYLLSRYGTDPEVTRLVDGQVFYIVPHVSPDGVNLYLTSPHYLRSSVRRYPFTEDQDGLQMEDLDGDGRILQMRVADPDGEWKVSDQDPRLLVPRPPHEFGRRYYRLMVEGVIQKFDGVEIKPAQARWGLDLNRNWPSQWEPEARQPGAGPFPLSEPETRAVAEFLLNHPNIHGLENFHTTTGIHLRPSALRADEKLDPRDRAVFKTLGKLGEEITGYPAVSIHDGFAYDKSKPVKGSFLDWVYDGLGLVGWSTELWDLRVRAGLDRVPFLTGKFDPEEDGLKILAWIDRENGGEGFFPWRPFSHSQLGEVEIGGWDVKYLLQNCPPRYLKAECHKNLLFTLKRAAAGPRLYIDRAAAEHLGEGVYRLEVVVKNAGYLPSSGTEQAKVAKAVRPDYVELSLPDGAELVLGKVREEIGHLDGRIVPGFMFYPGFSTNTNKARKLEWVVRVPAGGAVGVLAASQRGGKATATIALG